jgi:hypothetical protein
MKKGLQRRDRHRARRKSSKSRPLSAKERLVRAKAADPLLEGVLRTLGAFPGQKGRSSEGLWPY